jgi:hypothetical protein
MPAWLDDGAVEEAKRLDRWGAMGRNPDDSFRDSTVAAATPPAARAADTGGGSRYAAILAERREFSQRCKLLRSVEPGPALPVAR